MHFNGPDGDANILVFAIDAQLRALQSTDVIYMDGSFSSCPALWAPVYIQEVQEVAR